MLRKVMLFSSVLATMILAIGVSASNAWADWDTTTPYTKWVQLPDLQNGMNVNATYLLDPSLPTVQPVYPWQKILADDFLCRQTGPITDIHIWGSWLGDLVPRNPTDPNVQNVSFKLSLHKDVPKNPTIPDGYSYPGEEIWSWIFNPGEYQFRPWATSNELFYEPNTNKIIGTDTQVWQYNFFIDPALAPWQYGTAANPQVYWLDVQAIVPQPAPPAGQELPQYVFGWKTTNQPWNDDAVYGDTDVPGGPAYPQFPDPSGSGGLSPWKDMHYLTGPYVGQSINLAFAITTVPEPGTIVMLLGACVIGLVTYWRRR